ncbi:s-phase kinase-associated protein 1 [Xylaria intraflava]|nr:s-phase kinase-associated protein 1 [Xylaria intraflava]
MSANTLVTFKTITGDEIKATLQAVRQSSTMISILEIHRWDETTNPPISIVDIGIAVEALEKVMEWCEHHREDKDPETGEEEPCEENITSPLSAWDTQFFKPFDKELLFQITNASNTLGIPCLLQQCTYAIALRLKGMSADQMREFLGIAEFASPGQ